MTLTRSTCSSKSRCTRFCVRGTELGWLLVTDPLRWRRAIQAVVALAFLLGAAAGGAIVGMLG